MGRDNETETTSRGNIGIRLPPRLRVKHEGLQNSRSRYKSPVEMELMRTLKRTLDPKNIMNPGKVLLP